MKKFFFFFILLFCVSVSAAVPTVEFDWYQSGDKNASILTILQTIFDPTITTSSPLSNLLWGFDTDGNINSTITTLFTDNFNDGDFSSDPVWTVRSGSWAVGDNNRLTSTNVTFAEIDTPLDIYMPDQNLTIQFDMNINAAGTFGGSLFLARPGAFKSGYKVEVAATPANFRFFRIDTDGESIALIDSGIGASSNVQYFMKVTRTIDGNWTLFVNGTNHGSAVDTTFTDFNFVDVNNSRVVTAIISVDDINIVSGGAINTDKNEVHSFTSSGTKNVCLTAENIDGSTTTCNQIQVTQNEDVNVVIQQFDLNSAVGFNIVDLNAHFILRCNSDINTVADLNYTLILNDTEVHTSTADSNAIIFVPVTPLNGDNTATFTCSYNTLNIDSNTSNFRIFNVTFTLVNEETGVDWDPGTYAANFSDLNVKSYETGSVLDLIAGSTNTFAVSSLVDDIIRLDVNMNNGVGFHKEFSLFVLAGDGNISICLAEQQQIFEQEFASSQDDTRVLLNHGVTGCFSMATYTSNALGNVFAARAFTITDPYILHFFDGNVKVVLSNLDGGVAFRHNLQVLALNKIVYPIDIASDFLAISPVLNSITQENDSNKLQIVYTSLRQNNVALNLDIFLGSTIIWSHNETSSPNDIIVIFDFNELGLTDQNLLRLVATSTTPDETNTKTIYFNISTVGYGSVLPPIIAAAIAILLILFGLTLVTTQFSFSWFGILITLMGIAVLSLAPFVWWTLYLQSILLIILAFISFVYKNETSRVV